MYDDIIWLGNIVRVGSKTPRYLYNEYKNTIEFRTMKDKLELGYYDTTKDILYLNDRYKDQFKDVKRQIKKDYQPNTILPYCNLI